MSLEDIIQLLVPDVRYPLMDFLNLHPLGLRADWRTCREELMTAIKPFVVIDVDSCSDNSQGLLTRIPDLYPMSKWEYEEAGGLNMKEPSRPSSVYDAVVAVAVTAIANPI